MIILTTYIDPKTRIAVTVAPAKNGPVMPDLPGLKLLWALESEYPTNAPKFVCYVDDTCDLGRPEILAVYSDDERDSLYQQEQQARQDKAKNRLANQIRSERDSLLKSSDLYMLADYPISAESRQQWQEYRQALRDITAQPGFPFEVVWPIKPE